MHLLQIRSLQTWPLHPRWEWRTKDRNDRAPIRAMRGTVRVLVKKVMRAVLQREHPIGVEMRHSQIGQVAHGLQLVRRIGHDEIDVGAGVAIQVRNGVSLYEEALVGYAQPLCVLAGAVKHMPIRLNKRYNRSAPANGFKPQGSCTCKQVDDFCVLQVDAAVDKAEERFAGTRCGRARAVSLGSIERVPPKLTSNDAHTGVQSV